MQESPQSPSSSHTSQTSRSSSSDPQQRRLPPTPKQRRLGNRIAIGVMLLGLAVIILLDRFHVIH